MEMPLQDFSYHLPFQQVRLDSLEDLLDVMAVGNPVMQRMLSERRAALGMPPRDPQESDPTRQQPSNPTNYFDNIIYVCFTSKQLRGLYDEVLSGVYDESFPCALRGIYFVVNVTSRLRRNLRYDGRLTTKRLSTLIRRQVQITNAFDTSTLEINPPGFDVQDYIRLMPNNELALITDGREVVKPKGNKRQPDQWSIYLERTILDIIMATELIKLMLLVQIEKCIVTATVDAIDTDWAWYYFGCAKCHYKKVTDITNRDVVPVKHLWYCDTCHQSVTNTWSADTIITRADDEDTGDTSTIVSSDRSPGQVSFVSIESEDNTCLSSTPLSKRKGSSNEIDDLSSTSKKQCSKIIKVEKNTVEKMKRKHPVSFGADAHRKRAQSASKQITESSQTKDVPLTAVFARILNDVTNKNIAESCHPRVSVTVSKPNNKRGVYSEKENNDCSHHKNMSHQIKGISTTFTGPCPNHLPSLRQHKSIPRIPNTQTRETTRDSRM
ncbi:hypothetical protein YC2023_097976 [Brassica napus]